MGEGKLTARKVATLKQPGRYGDGHGLYLQVLSETNRSWLLRYELNGKERWMGLGPTHTYSLKDARKRAREARQKKYDGIDPLDAKRAAAAAARLAAAKAMTFGQCVEAYLETHDAGWKNAKHRQQMRMTLTEYCKPISNLSVSDIDTDLVLRCLTPLWQTRTATAKRLRGRIERVLSWAKGRGLRTGENPARWAGHLDEMLAAPSKLAPVENHPALPFADLPAFMSELRARTDIAARALEFLVLTAARTGEVLGATPEEINLAEKVWVIPAARMKAGKEHRVPLSERAIELLRALPREPGNKHLFIGGTAGKPMSHVAMLKVMASLRPGYVPHGLRSTFRDWAGETTNHANHVVEQALAHSIGSAVERAYRRRDLFEKRRKLMDHWARYATTQPTQAGGQVVNLRRVRP
jgi:integrase